jgi:hypothetical protein
MDTDTDTDMEDPDSTPPCLVVHFRTVDFPNVTAGMKAIVAGFVDKGKDLQRGRFCCLDKNVELTVNCRGEENGGQPEYFVSGVRYQVFGGLVYVSERIKRDRRSDRLHLFEERF